MRRIHWLLSSVLSAPTPAVTRAMTGAATSPTSARLLLVVALVLSVGIRPVPAAAAPNPTPNPLDVPFYSQFDPLWLNALIGAHEDVTMMKMGSLLSCVAMVAAGDGLIARFLVPGSASYFPSPTPDYIHEYLRDHNGYRASPAKTVIIDYHGLTDAFLNPLDPAGLQLVPMDWPSARIPVDQDLDRGRPSILYMQPETNRFHPVVVVGWDTETASYLVHDPAQRWEAFPVPIRRLYGADWEGEVAGALLATFDDIPLFPLTSGDDIELFPLISVSTKSPVETVAVNPEGRRVGFDVDAGTTVIDVAGASYLPQPVWADPTGELAPRAPGRLLTIPSAVDGRYRFEMIGTGDGPFTLSVRARNAGGDLVVDEAVRGTVTTGQVVKFQVDYSSTGPSRFTLGDNFQPEPNAGDDRLATVETPLEFNAGDSFDIDGTITSYQWDFGDGMTAAGQAVSHAYATPGTYTATLTITDDQGATASDSALVSVLVAAGTTERVSVGMGGIEAVGDPGSYDPSLSADGRFVAFESWATNLGAPPFRAPHIFVRDRQTGTIETVSPPDCVGSHLPDISADGRFVAFECRVVTPAGVLMDSIVVRDRLTGAVQRADVSDAGEGAVCGETGCGSVRPAISADGRFVAFYSDAANLVPDDTNGHSDAFVRDRLTGTTERVSVAIGGAQSTLGAGEGRDRLDISGDGRFVAFSSYADDLVPGIPPSPGTEFLRIFVRDRQTQVTELVSVSSAGIRASSTRVSDPAISADGRIVAFVSVAENLVPGDTNRAADVFVRDRVAGTTERVSVSGAGGQAVCRLDLECNGYPVLSADGRFVVFRSHAINLAPNDTNLDYDDVFVRDRQTGVTELVSLSTDGQQGDLPSGAHQYSGVPRRPAVSTDGRFVAFVSYFTNLVASDDNGIDDVFVRGRQPAGPVADPSGPYLGWATAVDRPAFVTLDASRSLDPAGRPLLARWDFGDGSPVAEAEAGTPVSHAYVSPGTYEVTLIVSAGGQDSTAVTTVAQILPPLGAPAMTLVPACGRPGDRITAAVGGHPLVSPAGGWDLGRSPLPAVRSAYPDDAVGVSFAGPAGSDPADQVVPIAAFSAESALEFSTQFSFTLGAAWTPGTYTVTAPDDGGASAGFTVPCPSLLNEPPHANTGGPYQGTVGLPVVFEGRLSADPESAPLTFDWFFEDGGTASGPRPSHTFLAPGTYWVLLVVNDGQLESPTSVGTNSYTTVTITAPPETTSTSTTTTTSTTATTTTTSLATTTTSTTTSTTTPPESDPCASAPGQPTFRSLACRLAALVAQTRAEPGLGNLRGRLLATLAKAKQRTELAEAQCADGQTKRATLRLKQVGRRLIQYVRRMRAVPEDIREPLAETARAIRADAETLRKALRCPNDASRP